MMKNITCLSLLMTALFFAGCHDDDNKTPSPVIDLAAHSITFTVDKTSDFEGTVSIRGTVKNLGGDYISGAGQQVVYLYEQNPGGPMTPVAKKEFSTLTAGSSLEVKYARAWRTSAEFPPVYILTISYGPDIYVDGKNTNDDQNKDNNRLERNGSEINALF